MAQKGREDYMQEIDGLRAKISCVEWEMEIYDEVYGKVRQALPIAQRGCEKELKRAVNRAMADAYIQWQEDEKV